MDERILCALLADRIDPTKFQLCGTEMVWLVPPTSEDSAAAADVIANYATLAPQAQFLLLKTQAINGIQSILDAKSRQFGFDNIHTAAVWATSQNAARAARGQALKDWADDVWDFAEGEWMKREAGMPTYATVEAFLAGLPEFGG